MAVERIIENHGNISKSMREVGYTASSATNPSNLTNSAGFKLLCEERGLTDTFLLDALVQDIKSKPKNRKPELELAFKVKGKIHDKEEPPTQTNNFFIINEKQRDRIARRIITNPSAIEESSSGLSDSNESEVRPELAP